MEGLDAPPHSSRTLRIITVNTFDRSLSLTITRYHRPTLHTTSFTMSRGALSDSEIQTEMNKMVGGDT